MDALATHQLRWRHCEPSEVIALNMRKHGRVDFGHQFELRQERTPILLLHRFHVGEVALVQLVAQPDNPFFPLFFAEGHLFTRMR